MATILTKFFDALNSEENKLLPRLAEDNLGIILRCAINELDWYSYNVSRVNHATEEQQEHIYLMQLGTSRLIHLALESRRDFDVPVVQFPRDRNFTIPVLEMVSMIGMIQHGRRVAQTVALGIGVITQTGENKFLVTLSENIIQDDHHENSVLQHYLTTSRQRFAKIAQSAKWKKLENEVEDKLSTLVYPFAKHFIGYGGDPILDEFFFGLAYWEISLQEGFDTFSYATRFGGVRFSNYILALTFVVANYIRHERFAEALIKKDTSIRLENILTISSETDSFVESIRDAVNYFGTPFDNQEIIDLKDARRIFQVLSCSRESIALVAAPGSALPLIIQCTDKGFIRCLTAAHSEPMRFLLNSLRHHFPKDYDSKQCEREGTLQRAIRRVLDETIPGLRYQENVTVSIDGRTMTDIDLVIIEEQKGTVVFCQLKHQELFGADIHAKRIRNDRLKRQVSTWLTTLDNWMTTVGDSGVRKALGLSGRFPDMFVHKVIISKHVAYPLKEVITEKMTFLFANWVQFVNSIILLKESHANGGLHDLMKIINEAQNLPTIYHLPEPTTTWTINDLVFVTKQEGAPEKP